jgi:hypothetical protein
MFHGRVIMVLLKGSALSSWSGVNPFSACRMRTMRFDIAGMAASRVIGCSRATAPLVKTRTASHKGVE